MRIDYFKEPGMVTSKQARAVIAATETHATKLGVPVNVAVLDAGAHLKAFSRMDRAVLGSVDIAMSKARTAVLFSIPSDAVWEYCKPGAPAPGLERSNGGLTTFAGGIPLFDSAGAVIGAVGVSGGTVAQDLEIATAGVEALQSFLIPTHVNQED
jgi:uncharacterized protein GlcG (DUF336 family)